MSDADEPGSLQPSSSGSAGTGDEDTSSGRRPARISVQRREGRRIELSGRDMFVFLVAAMGAAAAQLSTSLPGSLLGWAMLSAASIVGGLVVNVIMLTFLWHLLSRLLGRLRPLLRKALLLLAVLGLSAVNGYAVAVAWPLVQRADVERSGCPQPVQLRMLSTPEGLQSAREIARFYESHTARQHFGCPEADIYVYPAPPAEARQALVSGWAGDRLNTVGPRPDLWLPGSTKFQFVMATARGRLSEVDVVSVASTPIVLALPDTLLGEDIRLSRTGETWSQLLTRMWQRDWEVVRPDPAGSLVGQLATMAIYDSLARNSGKLFTVTEARAFEARLGQALDRFGYRLGGELDLLCHHLRDPQPQAAVIVTEQQMLRFNNERALGGACASMARPAHTSRMEGFYPTDTRGLDYPVVRLEWTDSSEDQIEQAQAFSRWLTTASGRAALSDTGLRPHGYSDGLPGVVFEATPPPADTLAGVIDLHDQATRPGRVLLALDASGSMREAAGDQSRMDVAKKGISATLALIGRDNELGLWVFRGAGRQELVPLGPADLRRPQVEQALPGVVPGGDTPLYDTIIQGVNALAGTDDQAIRAMVVLTDGEDSSSRANSGEVVTAVSAAGVRVFIVAVGEASCSSQALLDITEKSAGSCRQATFGGLEGALSEIFTLLWKGA